MLTHEACLCGDSSEFFDNGVLYMDTSDSASLNIIYLKILWKMDHKSGKMFP